MTLVRLKFAVPEAAGQQPSAGALRWTPTKRRTADDWVVMPAGFTVPLVNGEATVEVAPTGADWVWRVDENVPSNQGGSRYVAVPDLEEIDYTDLIEVDPKTLDPSEDPDPAWYAYVDTLEGQAATASASAVSAKNAAEAAQLSATGSETSAAASAATATTKAAEASTSATNAATSAASALTYKNDAADSADLAGRTGLTIGTVTTVDFLEDAQATITGTNPDRMLNLSIPHGPANELEIGEVITVPGTPLDDEIVAEQVINGVETKAELNARYVGVAKATTAGTEAHAQLGPKVRTKGAAAHSVLVLQNNDPASGDNATRIYIVPKGTTTAGVGGALKIFGDDYSTDQTNYRDLGIYFSQDQNGETGTRGDGCFYLNVKTNGTKAGLLPDLVFSMQDGTGIVGRASSPIVGGQSKYTMVIGPGKPEHAAKRALVLEVQGDMGFDGAADRSIFWETTGGVSSNKLAFERTASNGNLRLTLGGSQKATFTGSGDLVLGDNAADLAAASTVGFLHVRTTNGTPTGVPVTYAGAAPVLVDRAGSKLWTYIGGTWKSVTFV